MKYLFTSIALMLFSFLAATISSLVPLEGLQIWGIFVSVMTGLASLFSFIIYITD